MAKSRKKKKAKRIQKVKKRSFFMNAIREQGKTILLTMAAIFAISILGSFGIYNAYVRAKTRYYGTSAAAKVKKSTITYEELLERYRNLSNSYSSSAMSQKLSPETKLRLRANALNSLIEEKVLLQEAHKRHIHVSSKEIDDEVKRLENMVVGPPPPSPKSPRELPKWKKQLEERKTNFLRFLHSNGIESYSDLRSTIKTQLLIKKLKDEIRKEAEEKAEKEASKRIAEVKKALFEEKIPFEEAAKKYSDDQATKNKGGDLGWFGRGRMVKEFEEKVFSMKPGEITKEPVKTAYGYHFIKLYEKKEAKGPDYERAKEELKKELLEEKKKAGEKNPTVTEEELARKYEKVHAAHILISLDTNKYYFQSLEELKKEYSPEIDDPLVKAFQLYQKNDLEASLKVIEGVIKDYKDDPDIHYFKGLLLHKLAETKGEGEGEELEKEAAESLKKAIGMYEYDPFYHLLYAQILEKLGQKEEAVEELKEASSYAGSDFFLRYQLKTEFEKLGETDLAQQEQKEISELLKAASSQKNSGK